MFHFLLLLIPVLMLHARHRLLGSSLLNLGHHFVVFVGRQHTDKGHHALHKSAPAGTQTVGLRFIDHFVHRHRWSLHESVLRKTGCGVCVGRDIRLHLAVLRSWHRLRGLTL